MSSSCRASPTYEGRGETEYTIIGEESETGIEIRTRHDRVTQLDELFIVALKTTRDASPKQWQRQCINDSLPVQAAIASLLGMYQFPGQTLNFRWVVVDKKPPYRTVVYRMDPPLASAGHTEFYKRLDYFASCRDRNFWYPKDHGITAVLECPQWLIGADDLVQFKDDPNATAIPAREC